MNCIEVTNLSETWLDLRVVVLCCAIFIPAQGVVENVCNQATPIPVIERQSSKKCIRKAWISHVECLAELAMSFIFFWIFDVKLSSSFCLQMRNLTERMSCFYHLSSDGPSGWRERKQSIKMFPDSIWVESNAQCRLQFPLLLFVPAGRHMMLFSCNSLFRARC